MKVKLLYAACMLVVSGTALSQMTPQQQMQVPPSDPSSSQYNSVYLPAHGVGDTVQPSAKERWEDRWGAIATDTENAKLGVVTGVASKKKLSSVR